MTDARQTNLRACSRGGRPCCWKCHRTSGAIFQTKMPQYSVCMNDNLAENVIIGVPPHSQEDRIIPCYHGMCNRKEGQIWSQQSLRIKPPPVENQLRSLQCGGVTVVISNTRKNEGDPSKCPHLYYVHSSIAHIACQRSIVWKTSKQHTHLGPPIQGRDGILSLSPVGKRVIRAGP